MLIRGGIINRPKEVIFFILQNENLKTKLSAIVSSFSGFLGMHHNLIKLHTYM